MSNLLAQIENIKNSREQFEQEIKAKSQSLIQEFILSLFAECPTLNSFGWTQYTPFFNDGDECVFGIHSSIAVNEYDSDDWYNGKYHGEADEEPEQLSPELKGVSSVVWGMINGLGEEFLKCAYGDHVRVTIRREGEGYKAETDDYEHE